MRSRWIAYRVMQEIVRDRRTLTFFFLVPVIVMTLVYFAIYKDEVARVGLVTRGDAQLIAGGLEQALERQPGLALTPLGIPDSLTDSATLEARIRARLRDGRADAVLYFPAQLDSERAAGRPGTLLLFLEGSRPTLNAAAVAAVGGALASMAAALPSASSAGCPAACAAGAHPAPPELRRVLLYGKADYRLIDYFLPVLLPFFVFFFTFMVSTITFQRERTRGTLERLLIAPLSFTQVVLGYVAGFFVFSCIQMSIVLATILTLITFPVGLAQVAALVTVSLLVMLIALLLGLLVSFYAQNEFQAVQFVPLVILPQIFLSDLVWTLDSFPAPFRWLAVLLPLTHANALTRDLLLKDVPLWRNAGHLLALVAFFLLALALLSRAGRRAHGKFD